jgi:anti-sigma B factor antagonist
MFELNVESSDDLNLVISLKGEIDIYTAPDFKEKLLNNIGDGNREVVLDCSELSYMDSTGLGILVGALKRTKQHGRSITIKKPKSTVRKLFKITGLDKVFIVEEV